jgi:hypothetical protein
MDMLVLEVDSEGWWFPTAVTATRSCGHFWGLFHGLGWAMVERTM